jgi:Ion transport protein
MAAVVQSMQTFAQKNTNLNADRPPTFMGRTQRALLCVAEHSWFNKIFMTLILINTAAMAAEYDCMSSSMQQTLQQLNLVLTVAFGAEVLIKVRCCAKSCDRRN